MRMFIAVLIAAPLAACSGPDDPEPCAITGDPSLEIGVPDSITFLDFEPLVAGGDIPLSATGQTFLAVQLAIRATNLGREGFIEMAVTYAPTGGPARVANKDASNSERLFCRDDDQLYVVPVVVSTEELGDDLEIVDQTVAVEVTVTDTEQRFASAQATGVLRRIGQ